MVKSQDLLLFFTKKVNVVLHFQLEKLEILGADLIQSRKNLVFVRSLKICFVKKQVRMILGKFFD